MNILIGVLVLFTVLCIGIMAWAIYSEKDEKGNK